jgi:hypothetical protein
MMQPFMLPTLVIRVTLAMHLKNLLFFVSMHCDTDHHRDDSCNACDALKSVAAFVMFSEAG